jgi:spermidine/putrescine transport system substrate-binding protein
MKSNDNIRHRALSRLGNAVSGVALALPMMLAALPASAEGELNVYNWGDYINPEVLQRFSEEYDVEVNLDTYGSNEEMLAKIQAGATGYDIVFPSVHMHDIMHKLDLLWKSNINENPLFKNIDKDFLRAKTDPKGEWCLPYAWGTVGIFYNKDLVSGIESWADFFAIPDKHGEDIIMLPDMREVISVGLIVNDLSVNTTDMDDLRVAQQYILERKPKIAAFTYDGARSAVLSGDAAAAQWYVGAMMHVMENPEKYDYIIPEEGATMYQEDMCILKSAPNKENARKFMEFYLQPEIPVLNIMQQKNGTPNKAAREMLPPRYKNNPAINPPAEVMKKLQIFEDLGEDIRKYDRVWTRIRTQ